jgi:hypothetical protein
MFLEAKRQNPGKEIEPCGVKQTLADCFEMFGDKLAFWFNIGENTKAIVEDIEEDEDYEEDHRIGIDEVGVTVG